MTKTAINISIMIPPVTAIQNADHGFQPSLELSVATKQIPVK